LSPFILPTFNGCPSLLEIKYQWKQLKGQHTFAIVREALPYVISFMQKTLEHPGEEVRRKDAEAQR